MIGLHQNKIISSVLIHFPKTDGERLEIEGDAERSLSKFYNGQATTVSEITKLCTNPDFRGSDLLTGQLQQIAKHALKNNRPNIVMGTEEKLTFFFSRIGLKNTGIAFNVRRFGNLPHFAFHGNIRDMVYKTRNVNVQHWRSIWEPVAKDQIKMHSESLTLYESIFVRCMLAASSLAYRRTQFTRKHPKIN